MSDVRELLRRPVDSTEYEAIRELWKRHSKAEDQRDLPGLLSTLTDDCVYEIVGTEHVWHGHEGAARFYGGLLGGFPDIDFQLTDIVIGPQGVVEEADVTGTHEQDWLEYEATGERVEFRVVIFFPWDPVQKLFSGERIHVALGER
jgi:ketosteroid isomerase-like protein